MSDGAEGTSGGAESDATRAALPEKNVSPEKDASPGKDASASMVGEASALPGSHRGGYQRELTGPLDVNALQPQKPPVEEVEPWAPQMQPAASTSAVVVGGGGFAAWALGFAVVALGFSFFVGWGFPLGVAAIVTAIIALRRPLDRRGVAVWAIVLAVLSLVYSTGWLLWATTQPGLGG